MKRLCALLLALAMLLTLAACGSKPEQALPATEETAAPTEPETVPQPTEPEDPNLIPGGSFDEANSMWNIYTESGGDGSFSVSDGALHISVAKPGIVAHAVQIYCDGFEILKGAKYQMSFDLCSTVERTIEWRIQVNGGDYHAYAGQEQVAVGTEMQNYTFEFVMEEASDPAPRFCFNLGDAAGAQGLEAHEITVEHVTLLLLDASNAEAVSTETIGKDVNLNQVGYRPGDAKVAVFRNAADTAFEVVDAQSGEVVYTGSISGSNSVGSSGDTVAYGNFTEFTVPGTYLIRSANSGESYPFAIDEHVYDDLLMDTVKMLYLQRCGMELDATHAGDFAHPACHRELATILGSDETLEVSGGWHDAGDYGRYTVPGAKAAADLMLAYEMNPTVFTDSFGIPESGNGIPDVLDEARYELKWLMKMQNPQGGVCHKVTGMNFDGTVMPQDCTEKLYVMPVSLAATGDCAAAWYMGARLFEQLDPAFAEKCFDCAQLALAYCEENASMEGFVNPSGVSTGEYPDTELTDEYYWALCEGFKTSHNPELAQKISAFDLSTITEDGLGWGPVSLYGMYALLTTEDENLPDTAAAFERFAKKLGEIFECAGTEAYHSTFADDYPWGSNMTIANNGMLMLMAEQLPQINGSAELAKTQLNYLLGCNTTSYCFVTGYGTQSPVSTHHRPSQTLGITMKGMLSGGPNSNLEDPYAAQVLKGAPKAACYVDNSQSYSCNEITIYWNSPLVCLLAGIMK